MARYVTVAAIKISGIKYRARTRFDNSHPLAADRQELHRLIEQGWVRPLDADLDSLPGTPTPLAQLAQPNETRLTPDGQRVESVKYGRKEIKLLAPADDVGVTKIPALDPLPPRAPRVEAQPLGKWRLDPAALADKDIDVLNALVHEIDESVKPFPAGQEEDARALLSADFDQPIENESEGVAVAGGDLDASGDSGSRAVRVAGAGRRKALVEPGR